jgi:hypothetical protein
MPGSSCPLSDLIIVLIVLQSCLKRGLGSTCAYPDPEAQDHHAHHNSSSAFSFPFRVLVS